MIDGKRGYGCQKNDYLSYSSDIEKWRLYEQIFLPKEEYAHVISELNSHMTDEERRHTVVSKSIGENVYTIINKGFDEYVVIGKRPIVSGFNDEWEELK